MQNVYQIGDYKAHPRGGAALRHCYCDAGRYRQDFFTNEMSALHAERRSQAILRLECLDYGVPLSGVPGESGWDLIYSTELMSELPVAAARQVVRIAASRLRPGGRLLLANVSLNNRFRECPDCAKQVQAYRSETEMAELADILSSDSLFTGQAVFRDPQGLNVYLEVYRGV